MNKLPDVAKETESPGARGMSCVLFCSDDENGRILCLPDHTPENWKNQLRGLNETIENYTLTQAERDAIQAEKMKAMMEMMAKMKEEGKEMPTMGWAVPEGAEAFGQARKDLDWIKR